MQYETLTDILTANRKVARAIHFIEGEHDETVVPFAELY